MYYINCCTFKGDLADLSIPIIVDRFHDIFGTVKQLLLVNFDLNIYILIASHLGLEPWT